MKLLKNHVVQILILLAVAIVLVAALLYAYVIIFKPQQ